MSANNPDLRDELPSAAEYQSLRREAGWGNIQETIAERALKSSAICICARIGEQLVGLGRVVGDGVLYFYLSDIFVHPSQRGSGLGPSIARRLIKRIEDLAEPGASVAVIAAPGREGFYEKLGFQRCPNRYFGEGLVYLEPIERLQLDHGQD